MLLVMDAGNTQVTLGVFDGAELRAHWRLRTEPGRTEDEYAALLFPLFAARGWTFSQIDGVCLASVVPGVTPDLVRLARTAFGREPVVVTGTSPLGLRVAYDPPDAVGADRLVDALAAVHRVGAPCVVIDFGTATTFNAIAAPEAPGGPPVYLGGAISLGLRVSLDALFAKAAKIPSVDLARPPRAIGGNTREALQSGIVLGTVAQVEALVARFRAEMAAPDCPVLATGGHAALIAAETPVITEAVPGLTLDGLRLAYEAISRNVF